MRTLSIILPVVFIVALSSSTMAQRTRQVRKTIVQRHGTKHTPDVPRSSSIDTTAIREVESSFREGTFDDLATVLVTWNRAIGPDDETFIGRNDTIKAVYGIFRAIYRPLNYLEYVPEMGERDTSWHPHDLYVIVQNKIRYAVSSTDSINAVWGDQATDSITSFRPPVTSDRSRVLYLTDPVEKAINRFLGTGILEEGDDGGLRFSRPHNYGEEHYQSLRQYILIRRSHWLSYWHLETHPVVTSIFINRTLTRARVFFWEGYHGRQADVKRDGEQWVVIVH